MKNLFLKMAFVAVAFAGVASAAHAGIYEYQYYPTCATVWVQTGPFPGQGFYDQVCN